MGKGGKAIGGIIAADHRWCRWSCRSPARSIAFFAARDSFPEFGGIGPTDDTTYLPGQAPGKSGVNVHTVDGYNEMVDALRDETDATYTFTAVLYPRYASIQVPTGTNDRYQNFYWNGEELELQDIKGTTDDGQVDLSLVDPQQMVDMLDTVRGRMDNPENWYVIISERFGEEVPRSAPTRPTTSASRRSSPRPSTAPSSTTPSWKCSPPAVAYRLIGYCLGMSAAGHPIVAMGVSGSGKSTVGAALAGRLRVPFEDADDLHPQANIDKMTRGEPLDDKRPLAVARADR